MSEKIKILLVEDDMNLGFVIQDSLSLSNYHVHLSKDGKEGLLAFNKDQYDICLLDVMLPKKDGFSLASKSEILVRLFLKLYTERWPQFQTHLKKKTKNCFHQKKNKRKKEINKRQALLQIQQEATTGNGKEKVQGKNEK